MFSKISESKEGLLSLLEFSPPLVETLRVTIGYYRRLYVFIEKYRINLAEFIW